MNFNVFMMNVKNNYPDLYNYFFNNRYGFVDFNRFYKESGYIEIDNNPFDDIWKHIKDNEDLHELWIL